VRLTELLFRQSLVLGSKILAFRRAITVGWVSPSPSSVRDVNTTIPALFGLSHLGLAEKLTNQARAKNAGIESRMRWARRVRGKLSWAGDRHRRYSDALAARSGAS